MINSTVKTKIDSADGVVNNESSFSQGTVFVTVNCVLNVPLMLISILGNALVVAAIIRTSSIRSTSMTVLCSLAVSDLLVGFIVQPFFIASELTTDPLMEKLSEMMEFALCGVSLCTMTAISVDRFMALHHPMRYQSAIIAKRRVIHASIITIWVINFSQSSVYFFNWSKYFSIMALGVCLCIFISTYSYIKIYQIVRQHQIQIQAQQQSAVQSTFDKDHNLNMLRIKRSAINTFTFYIAMILCYTPILISMCLSSISYKHWTKTWHLADTVVFLNSSVNPLLYCWRLGDLRSAVLKTSRKVLCKETTGD